MGIPHQAVTNPEEEYEYVKCKLEFFNVSSPGRDRWLKRMYDLENERMYRLRHPEGAEMDDIGKNEQIHQST